MANPKKPLEPLIPLEQFKELVAGIAHVPKAVVSPAIPEADNPTKRQAKKKPSP